MIGLPTSSAVRDAADHIHDEMMGRVVASVRTAVPLDDALRTKISDRLGSLMNKQVRLRESVDPDLIGGIVIRVGDRVFDSSVSNRLDKIAKRTRAGFASQLMHKFQQFTIE